jgi:hypothetical protein
VGRGYSALAVTVNVMEARSAADLLEREIATDIIQNVKDLTTDNFQFTVYADD